MSPRYEPGDVVTITLPDLVPRQYLVASTRPASDGQTLDLLPDPENS